MAGAVNLRARVWIRLFPHGLLGNNRKRLLQSSRSWLLTCRKRPSVFCVDSAKPRGEDGAAANRTLGCEEGRPKMRKLLFLCGVILCLSMTPAAKDATASFDPSSPEGDPAAPVTFEPVDRTPWQIGIGYQYQHFKA